MKKTLLLTMAALMFCFSAYGDFFIKTKTHTDEAEMMGQKYPARDEISEQWIGDGQFQHSTPALTIILDWKQDKMFLLYHKSKTYVETALPLDMTKIMTEQQIAMLKMWKISATVTPANETKKIGQWDCTGYDVTSVVGMMSMKARNWAATVVAFDYTFFQEKIYPALFQATMGQKVDEQTLSEFLKIKGFSISQEITFLMGESSFRMTTLVEEITEKAAPAGIYVVPADYRKTETINFSNWSS